MQKRSFRVKYSKDRLSLMDYTDPYMDCYYDWDSKQYLYKVKSTDQWLMPNSEGDLIVVEMED